MHLIATDPPFNKNRDHHATPDSLAAGARFKDRWRWDEDVHEEWTDGIIDDWPAAWEVITAARAAYGDDMGAFLCWLGVRLMEMRRVLRPDGSIYLHIDHTAHAYVKCLMDAIFGRKNFRNEIVWCYTGPSNTKRWFPRKHDTLLFYTKTEEWTFNYDDPLLRIAYKPSLTMGDWQKRKGGDHTTGLDEQFAKGKLIEDWWCIPRLANSRESTGYPTQKPLALYRRIIAASSNPGDIVLDPFCGCATTPVAAEQLGRHWVGMDIWDKAHETVLSRLEEEWLFTPDASEKVMFPHIVHYEIEPPARTDESETAAPSLELRSQRAPEPWQKLSRKEMVALLEESQKTDTGVICAGCGRVLEAPFMQLDHITPKSDRGENHILNRILLCGPCNLRKRDNLTLRGLMRENKKIGWLENESLALLAQDGARQKAEEVRSR